MLRLFKDLFGSGGSVAAQRPPTPEDIYRQAVATRLTDKVIDDLELEALKTLQNELGLTDEQAINVYKAEAHDIIQTRILEALADGSLDPDEDAEIACFGPSLRLGLTFDEGTVAALEKARRTWAILNSPLPAVPSPLGLQRGEVAYLAIEAEALEERSRTRAVSYAGPTMSIPIAGGLRFRMGHMAFAPHVTQYMHSFGIGTMVVTDRRLIFASPQRSHTAKLENILDIESFTDGVRVTRTTGKPHLFRYSEDRTAALVVLRAWTEARQ